jgi:hypothetical protein
MKLKEALLLSLSVAFLIIGIHQIMVVGFAKGYWAIMLALVSFFAYSLVRPRKGQSQTSSGKQGPKSAATRPKTRKR